MSDQLLYPVYSLLLNVPPSGAQGPSRTLIRTGLRIFDLISMDACYLVLSKKMFGRIRPDRVFFGFEYFRYFHNGKARRSLSYTKLTDRLSILHAFTKTGFIEEFPGYFRNDVVRLLLDDGIDPSDIA